MRKRDHRKAYARRIERGLSKGLTLAEARGHGHKRERLQAGAEDDLNNPLRAAMAQVAQGASLTGTAREFRVSRERLRTYIESRAELRRERGRLRIVTDRRRYRLPLYSAGEPRVAWFDRPNAKVVGEYMAAVGRFLESNRTIWLEPFKGRSVRDQSGSKLDLETDPNRLYALDARGETSIPEVYRAVIGDVS